MDPVTVDTTGAMVLGSIKLGADPELDVYDPLTVIFCPTTIVEAVKPPLNVVSEQLLLQRRTHV